jgi:hypothetical protein
VIVPLLLLGSTFLADLLQFPTWRIGPLPLVGPLEFRPRLLLLRSVLLLPLWYDRFHLAWLSFRSDWAALAGPAPVRLARAVADRSPLGRLVVNLERLLLLVLVGWFGLGVALTVWFGTTLVAGQLLLLCHAHSPVDDLDTLALKSLFKHRFFLTSTLAGAGAAALEVFHEHMENDRAERNRAAEDARDEKNRAAENDRAEKNRAAEDARERQRLAHDAAQRDKDRAAEDARERRRLAHESAERDKDRQIEAVLWPAENSDRPPAVPGALQQLRTEPVPKFRLPTEPEFPLPFGGSSTGPTPPTSPPSKP